MIFVGPRRSLAGAIFRASDWLKKKKLTNEKRAGHQLPPAAAKESRQANKARRRTLPLNLMSRMAEHTQSSISKVMTLIRQGNNFVASLNKLTNYVSFNVQYNTCSNIVRAFIKLCLSNVHVIVVVFTRYNIGKSVRKISSNIFSTKPRFHCY